MAAHERVLVSRRDVFLLREAFERLEHPAARLPRGLEELHASLVGSRLLRAPLAQHRPHDHFLAAHHDATARAPDVARRIAPRHGAADHEADSQHHEQQGLGLIACHSGTQRGHVPACDVPGLMRDHPDDLVGRLGLQDRAGVHEHVEAVDHESVEALVPDDTHGDVRAEARCLEDWPRIVLQQVLYLGIADQGNALRGGGCGSCARCEGVRNRQKSAEPLVKPASRACVSSARRVWGFPNRRGNSNLDSAARYDPHAGSTSKAIVVALPATRRPALPRQLEPGRL